MTILEIFENVNIKTPVEQRIFFNYFNASVNEISALHGDMPYAVFGGKIKAGDNVRVKSLTDEPTILPLYHEAIIDNILFLCGQGDAYKGEFIRKSKEAFNEYWSEYSKKRRIKRKRGWD